MEAAENANQVLREEPRQTALLTLDSIETGERLRSVNGGTVQHLAESMRFSGLQTPIQVRKNETGGYVLVSGAHRLQAARSLAWPHIEAFILDLLDEDTLALLEIDENLMRVELNPLDRGRFIARRKEIYERLYPETRRGGDRRSNAWQDQNDDLSHKGFVAETASFTPFSPWTIRRAIRIGDGIIPELREELAMTPIAHREGDLYDISGLSDDEQEVVLEDLQSAEHEVQKLSDIHPRREPEEKPPEEPPEEPEREAEPASEKTVLERVQSLWISASDEEKQEIVAWIDLMKGQANTGQPAAS